jgi:MYXO-CTERM domain-containing protein
VNAKSDVVCGASSCTNGAVTAQMCNGAGSCMNGAPVNCAPYACGASTCKTSCAAASDCDGTAYCTAQSECKTKADPGKACAADQECSSGHCVDGVCCDTTCTGQCEACDVAGHVGTCSPASGKPHGSRKACTAGAAECAGACDGVNPAACAYPGKETSCGAPSCAAGQSIKSSCNGKGDCSADTPVACSPYQCGATSCKDTCAGDADCVEGFRCETATSKCVPSTGKCKDLNTWEDSKGTPTPCAPYTCQSGACLKKCVASIDCASGNVCDTQQSLCVPAAPAASTDEDSGGCGCRTAPSQPGGLAASLVLLLSWALRRRRN